MSFHLTQVHAGRVTSWAQLKIGENRRWLPNLIGGTLCHFGYRSRDVRFSFKRQAKFTIANRCTYVYSPFSFKTKQILNTEFLGCY